MSRPNSSRRPTVTDGLALIAAFAIAFALVRHWTNPSWCVLPPLWGMRPPQTPSAGHLALNVFSTRLSWTIPFAMTATLTLPVLRLRRPRPPLRRLFRQPGLVACAAAVIAMVFRTGQLTTYYLLEFLTKPASPFRLPSPPFLVRVPVMGSRTWGETIHDIVLESFPFQISPTVTAAVIVAWTMLWASGRWRPERGWLDRAGRLLGWYWIAQGILIGALSEVWKFLL
jgi:hypothetical protein